MLDSSFGFHAPLLYFNYVTQRSINPDVYIWARRWKQKCVKIELDLCGLSQAFLLQLLGVKLHFSDA